LSNGIRVAAWTFDELYGRDTKFLDELNQLGEAFIGEIPGNFHGWLNRPKVIRAAPKSTKNGRPRRVPRVRKAYASRRVDNLTTYSPVFTEQRWQRYRIKDSDRGPEVWEVKWALFWRKTIDKLPAKQHTLIVARNVRTGEVKYFLSNRAVGRNGVTLRWLLRVAFGRWAIEACFRTAKEELGLDHFEARGWRCVHRHWYVTQLSHLFCSRLRQTWDDLDVIDPLEKLTVEQVRAVVDAYLKHRDLPPPERTARFQVEINRQRYHQKRNAQASKSHTKTRRKLYEAIGINVDKIKSCKPPHETS
jgi:SRSO17 transposase